MAKKNLKAEDFIAIDSARGEKANTLLNPLTDEVIGLGTAVSIGKYLRANKFLDRTILLETGTHQGFLLDLLNEGIIKIVIVSGKGVHDERERLGVEKRDESDPKVILEYYLRTGKGVEFKKKDVEFVKMRVYSRGIKSTQKDRTAIINRKWGQLAEYLSTGENPDEIKKALGLENVEDINNKTEVLGEFAKSLAVKEFNRMESFTIRKLEKFFENTKDIRLKQVYKYLIKIDGIGVKTIAELIDALYGRDFGCRRGDDGKLGSGNWRSKLNKFSGTNMPLWKYTDINKGKMSKGSKKVVKDYERIIHGVLWMLGTNFIKNKNEFTKIYYEKKKYYEKEKPEMIKSTRHNFALWTMIGKWFQKFYRDVGYLLQE